MISAEAVEMIDSAKPKFPRYWFEIVITEVELKILRTARSGKKTVRWYPTISYGVDNLTGDMWGTVLYLDNEKTHRIVSELEKFGYQVEVEYKCSESEGEEWKGEKPIEAIIIKWGNEFTIPELT